MSGVLYVPVQTPLLGPLLGSATNWSHLGVDLEREEEEAKGKGKEGRGLMPEPGGRSGPSVWGMM